MKTIKCDKCGKDINRHPLQQIHFPSFSIFMTGDFRCRQVDLCNDCEKELYAWLKGADDE